VGNPSCTACILHSLFFQPWTSKFAWIWEAQSGKK
jgi:hypothetical protein